MLCSGGMQSGFLSSVHAVLGVMQSAAVAWKMIRPFAAVRKRMLVIFGILRRFMQESLSWRWRFFRDDFVAVVDLSINSADCAMSNDHIFYDLLGECV